MPFSNDDKALINNLQQFKEYASQKIVAEFSENNWKKKGLKT